MTDSGDPVNKVGITTVVFEFERREEGTWRNGCRHVDDWSGNYFYTKGQSRFGSYDKSLVKWRRISYWKRYQVSSMNLESPGIKV